MRRIERHQAVPGQRGLAAPMLCSLAWLSGSCLTGSRLTGSRLRVSQLTTSWLAGAGLSTSELGRGWLTWCELT
jgi:uncharacterized protein YjbI with pentapeptide repeats